jgi:hypothetical protein
MVVVIEQPSVKSALRQDGLNAGNDSEPSIPVGFTSAR